MYFKGAICDLYIGTEAGQKLMEDIGNAKRSIKIISPVLLPLLAKELIDLHYRDIGVQLVTMDSIEDFHGPGQKILQQFVIQDRSLDFEKEALRSMWIKRKRLLIYLSFAMVLLLCGMAIKEGLIVVWGVLPLLLVLSLIWYYTLKIGNAKIYKYFYRSLFPSQIIAVPNSQSHSNPFLYEKMYLIDDEIVYLGALNFFDDGTKGSHGIQIRITDQNVIKELVHEFETFFHNVDLPKMDIAQWGRKMYTESRN